LRHTYNNKYKIYNNTKKALLLLEYLVKNGSKQVVLEAKVHLLQIKTLKDFQYVDEDRKDVGLSGMFLGVLKTFF
jgi:epsin